MPFDRKSAEVVDEEMPAFLYNAISLGRKHADLLVLASLWTICILLCSLTWAQWGNVSIDVGREMYVPAQLNRGRVLYRDVMYPYGPLIPYWHAFLYRAFGTNLNVIYSVSLAIVLAIVSLLYRLGRNFLPPSYAFTAGLAFLLEAYQFKGNIFSYGLPYSFPATYGSLAMVLMAYFGVRAIKSSDRRPVFWAGVTTAAALLIKQEFGFFSLVLLTALLLVRYVQRPSGPALRNDMLVCIPPLFIAAAVYLWFCSLGGLRLLLEENFMSAPQHYFTKHYGRLWAEQTGMRFTFNRALRVLGNAIITGAFWAIWIVGLRWILRRLDSVSGWSKNLLAWIICFLPAVVIGMAVTSPTNPRYAFPYSMYVFVLILFIVMLLPMFRGKLEHPLLARAFLIFSALLVAFRVSTKVTFFGYAVYYNLLLYLCLLILLFHAMEKATAATKPFDRLVMHTGAVFLLIAGLVIASVPNYRVRIDPADMLVTPRGKIGIYPHQKAAPYREMLAFFESAKAKGQSVMVLPEDTTIYFLSDLSAPSRFYELTPGVIAPGRVTESYLRDLDRAKVDYIVLTNRPSAEYGVPYFGIDFDQPVQHWIDSHYEIIGQIGHFSHHLKEIPWGALIYQRRDYHPRDQPSVRPFPG